MPVGFRLRHPYGAIVMISAFLLPLHISNLLHVYGSTQSTYPPYIISIPLIGTVMFFGMALSLATLQPQSKYIDAFTPLAAVGFGSWTVICAALNLLYTQYITTALGLAGGVITIAVWWKVGQRSFPDPTTFDAPTPRWMYAVIIANTASLAAFIAVYLKYLPIDLTILIVTVYVITSMLFPIAIFTAAYHRADTNDTWRFPTIFGCLGVASLLTLGILNVLVTGLYVIRTVTAKAIRKAQPRA